MIGVQRGLYGLVCGVLIFAMAGCGGGEKLVTVTGKVVDGGQPVAFEEFEGVDPEAIEEMGLAPVEVELWPVDEAGNIDSQRKPHGTDVQLDGSFAVLGPDGDGVPAGKYRVALVYTAGMDMGMKEEEIEAPWGDKFTKENGPTYEFTGDQEIALDIATAGGAGTPESNSPESGS